jgi:dUTP pyrophosphatase
MRLAVRRLSPDAELPTRSHGDDAGFDLYAAESATVWPGQRASVRTGIAVEIPQRHAGLVLPRSGLAAEHGIALVNAPGLIDAGYRGEIRILLLNTDADDEFEVAPGDRIAQLLIVRVEAPDIVEVEELAGSDRGESGFGSTGRR